MNDTEKVEKYLSDLEGHMTHLGNGRAHLDCTVNLAAYIDVKAAARRVVAGDIAHFLRSLTPDTLVGVIISNTEHDGFNVAEHESYAGLAMNELVRQVGLFHANSLLDEYDIDITDYQAQEE